jgi:hypothetical protein
VADIAVKFLIACDSETLLIIDLIRGRLLTGEENIRVEAENGSRQTRETSGGAA